MLLKLALWQDVHEYLERRTDIVIPVGGTEQHGPTGPVGTDLILAEELANDLGQERSALVAPPVPFGSLADARRIPGNHLAKAFHGPGDPGRRHRRPRRAGLPPGSSS